jgi:hypothetical protein
MATSPPQGCGHEDHLSAIPGIGQLSSTIILGSLDVMRDWFTKVAKSALLDCSSSALQRGLDLAEDVSASPCLGVRVQGADCVVVVALAYLSHPATC